MGAQTPGPAANHANLDPMAINQRYAAYLAHFGKTVTTGEFVRRPEAANLVALRHDVDYSIDVALECGFREQEAGCRATYFMLHTAPYWSDPQLIDKCLQLQDLGHEIGLHINLLAQWHRGEIDDIGRALEGLLRSLRAAGLKIEGVAAHGDASCYTVGFTNYWLFADLRPADPATAERGVTAEGSRAGASSRRIDYPADRHALMRADGKSFDYWSLKLQDFGLRYEASRLDNNRYFSDSGGSWKRSPDPISEDLSTGRVLVLMHPIYWKPPQQHYYFLSTARSGSKWLAAFLDKATSVRARHEFTLNHTFDDGEPKPAKRTGAGFTDLLANRDEAEKLITASRAWSEKLDTSFAEANIYLERFLDLIEVDESTHLVHLSRNPRPVVRSLLQRGWYEVPFDDRHPAVNVAGWSEMSQLEQVCHYVADVNARLAARCETTLEFEKMVSDLPYLTDFLEKLGIIVYPRLAAKVFADRVNATPSFDVADIADWPAADKETFERILGAHAQESARSRPATTPPLRFDRATAKRIAGKLLGAMSGSRTAAKPADGATLLDLALAREPGQLAPSNGLMSVSEDGRLQMTLSERGISHVLLGGGFWHGAKALLPLWRPGGADLAESPCPAWGGWRFSNASVLTLGLELAGLPQQAGIRVICLSYDKGGLLIAKKDLGVLSADWPRLSVNFRPARGAETFNVALYRSQDQPQISFELTRATLLHRLMAHSRSVPAEEALAAAEAAPQPAAPAFDIIRSPDQLAGAFRQGLLGTAGEFRAVNGALETPNLSKGAALTALITARRHDEETRAGAGWIGGRLTLELTGDNASVGVLLGRNRSRLLPLPSIKVARIDGPTKATISFRLAVKRPACALTLTCLGAADKLRIEAPHIVFKALVD